MAKITVDDYIDSQTRWRTELTQLRAVLAKLGMEESIKWGAPCYSYSGKSVVGMSAFKSYFGLWFFLGARLRDDKKLLINAQKGKTRDLRQWRMTSAADIKVRTIRAYLKEAKALVDAGEKPSRTVTKEAPSSAELEVALNADPAARKAFAGLSPGRQREYAAYVNDARQASTRLKRVAKVLPMILDGNGLNDQYRC
jgi:uncharacterized protein YdeI (YjbR/CyaY-like superfamily)